MSQPGSFPKFSSVQKLRPLSPHLSIYKRTMPMMMSITHRLTGLALYFGTALIVVRLFATSVSQDFFSIVNMVFYNPLGRVVLFLYVWALLHHSLGGIRYLIQGFGYALDPLTAYKMAWATLLGSLTLSLCLWIFVFSNGIF